MKKVLILSFLVFSSAGMAGITGKISGTINNAVNRAPLPAANIVVMGTNLGAISDMDGKFFIINVPPGSYRVRATMMGYQTMTVEEVRIKIDQTTIVDFGMREQVLEGERITILAEKPRVEIDLTASKQTVTNDEIKRSWGTDLRDVISDLPGVNINGGIRGSFGLDVAYHLDGMDMRDIASNTNFSAINLSTVQEVEVLTGGWNAEYGQANGAIVNVVSKSSSDRIRGIVAYRMRPPGVYHWGRNMYSKNDIFHTVMTTPEFWDANATWQTKWMDKPQPGYNGGVEPYKSMTPQQRADWWKQFINDEKLHPQIGYADHIDWETEVTLYGPIMKNIGFMLSGRYKEGVPRYPSALKYNPDMTLQGSVNFKPTSKIKVDVSGIYTKFDNSGAPKTNFASTEDTFHDNQDVPYIRDPYSRWKFWMYGTYSSSEFTIRAPEYANILNLQTKLTWVFNPNTLLEIALQHSRMEYIMNYRDIMRTAYYGTDGLPTSTELDPPILPESFISFKWSEPGDFWLNSVKSNSSTIKADFSGQLTRHHQFKAGWMFSYQMVDKILHDSQQTGGQLWGQVTDLAPTKAYPYEGALYLQDKMEFEGMVINAGLRLDFFNANKTISANVFDPLMISESTAGNIGQTGRISWQENGKGSAYKDTPMRVALSPRIGISHPISENTVLHFMYGHFNQRPPWQKITGPTVVRTLVPKEGMDAEWKMDAESQLVYYNYYTYKSPNPGLTWERMIQYEVGFEQNIANLLSLDLTMYYKDAHNLTSNGISQGPASLNIARSGGDVNVRLYGDPRYPTEREAGKTQGYFITTVNGAWADVRGIETTLATRFRYVNIRANYTLSFLNTGSNHLSEMYKEWNGKKLGEDIYNGAGNTDDGQNGTDDDTWNPHNSAVVRVSLATPKNYGFKIGPIHPLSQWYLTTSTSWAQGRVFTYHSPGDLSTSVNNRRWKDRWNTNVNLSKTFEIYKSITCRMSVQVANLFNQKHLRLPASSAALTEYFENGLLPVQSTTREPMVWSWYYNHPREAYFGLTFEF